MMLHFVDEEEIKTNYLNTVRLDVVREVGTAVVQRKTSCFPSIGLGFPEQKMSTQCPKKDE